MAVTTECRVKMVDAATLQDWLSSGEALVVDVREPAEFAAEHIPGAKSLPLSRLRAEELPVNGHKLVLQCKSGARSAQAAVKLVNAGVATLWDFDGGIEAWKQAGLPVEGTHRQPMDILRQTQLTVGVLNLTGVILGAAIGRGWLVLCGMIGVGLLVAGLTGKCPLAMLIAKLPWNQKAGPGCAC